MKTSYRLLVLIFLATTISCAQPTSNWLDENTVKIYPNGSYDFTGLAEYVKDKKIVAIGESTHGLGKYFELKSELVKYLHSELGFEVLAMESSLADVNLAYHSIGEMSGQELMNNSLFGNFRVKEIWGLFDYIKATSTSEQPLLYTGFDNQTSSDYFTDLLKEILKKYKPALVEQFDSAFESYSKVYPSSFEPDSTNYIMHRDLFMRGMANVGELLTENESTIKKDFELTPFQYEIIVRSINDLHRYFDFSYAQRKNADGMYRGIEFRDELMYQNLVWLMEEIYPDKKFIIWGYNGHIDNEATFWTGAIDNPEMGKRSTKWMGHFLKEKYKDDYYSIGLFAYKGEAWQFWQQEAMPFEHTDSTFVENIMRDSVNQITFLNLQGVDVNPDNQWISKKVRGMEFESGGVVEFVPRDRFDALIQVEESTVPTFK